MALSGFIALAGLAGAALLCSVSNDVASSALLGSPGTELALGAVMVITVVGVVVAWRPTGRSARIRQLVTLLLVVAAGLTTAVSVGFFAGGEYADVGILLIQAAVFIVVIATRIQQSSTAQAGREGARR